MRVERGELRPGGVIRPEPGEWYPRMPERLDEKELADRRARHDAVSARGVDDWRGDRGRRHMNRASARTDYVVDSFIQNIA